MQPAARLKTFLKTGVNVLTGEKVIEKDPIAMFGYGTVAYIKLISFFQWVFLGLSILQIPTILAYKRGDFLPGIIKDTLSFEDGKKDYKTAQANEASYETYMLGNLGYSSVECDLTPVLAERIGMLCSFGEIG